MENASGLQPPLEKQKNNLNRRDFIKLGSLSLLAGAIVAKDVTKRESLNNSVVEIETTNALYYPVYEDHVNPADKSDLQKLPGLDLLFYEFMDNSNLLLAQDPTELINRDMSNTLQSNIPDSKRLHVFPRDQLDHLLVRGTSVSLEGYKLPEKETLKYFGALVSETLVGAAGAISYFAAKSNFERKNPGKKFVGKNVDLAAKSAAAWLLSPVAETMAGLTSSSLFGTDTEINAMQRVASRLTAISTHTHPENNIIFFRNLLMTRKLQFLGSTISKDIVGKPKIGFNVGMQHAGIEDMLMINPDIILNMIGHYPPKLLKEITDFNGGIDAFTSTIILTPNTNRSKRSVIKDNQLNDILNKRINGLVNSK